MHLYIDKCIPWREREKCMSDFYYLATGADTTHLQRIYFHFWMEGGVMQGASSSQLKIVPRITYAAHNILMQPWCSCLPRCVGKMQWYTMNWFWLSVYQSQTHLTMLQRKLWLTLMTHNSMFEEFVCFFLSFATLQSDRMVSVLTVVTYMKKKIVFKKKMMKWTRL